MTLHLSDLLLVGPLSKARALWLGGDPLVSSLRVVRDWDGLSTVGRDDAVLLDIGEGQGGWLVDAAVRTAWQAYAAVVVVADGICLFDSPARLAERYRVCLLTVAIADSLDFQLELGQQIRDSRADLVQHVLDGITAVCRAPDDVEQIVDAARPFLGAVRVAEVSPEEAVDFGEADDSARQVVWPPPAAAVDPVVRLHVWLPEGADPTALEQFRPLLEVVAQRLSLHRLATQSSSGATTGPGLGRSMPSSLVDRALDSDDWRAAARALVEPLDNTPRDRELLHTLQLYLESGSLTETAARLNIHRNTATTRISQVGSRLGLSLDDPDVRLALQLGCRVWAEGDGR